MDKHKERKLREQERLRKEVIRDVTKVKVGMLEGGQGPRSKAPRVLGLKAAKVTHESIVSQEVNSFSRALASGMTLDDADVKMPLAGNGSLVAKKSATVTNTGQALVSSPAAGTTVTMWLYPDGEQGSGKGFKPTGVQSGTGSAYPTFIGANVNCTASTPQLYSAVGMYRIETDAAGLEEYFAPNSDPGLLGLEIDDLDLLEVPEKPSDFMNRTVKLTVEISVVSALVNTRGGVRVYNPYMAPGNSITGGTSVRLKAARRDPSYVDQPFSGKRTFSYTYMPNAESVNYGTMTTAVNSTSPFLYDSRFVLQAYGLGEGDEILVRFIWTQEYTGTTVNPIATPSVIAPDYVHLANAIPHLTNYSQNGKKNPTLSEHVAAMKIKSHPVAVGLAKAAGIDEDDHKSLAKHATSLLEKMSDLGPLGPLGGLLSLL